MLAESEGVLKLNSLGYMSYALSFDARFRGGAFCSIAIGCKIMGGAHPMDRVSTSPISYGSYFRQLLEKELEPHEIKLHEPYHLREPEPVQIGDDVWIGGDVTFKGGVRIGTGAVIAANATVTRDVPPYAVVAGLPAKVIKYRFPPDVCAMLLDSQWWDYSIKDLGRFSFSDPVAFCKAFAKEKPNLQKRQSKIFTAKDLLALR
jgi:acetyltransferase-like isoleucine patch superfamily enzyme